MPFAGFAAALGSYHRQVTQVTGDPYFNNVVMLVPMVGQDGGTFFYEVGGRALQRNGSPVISKTMSRYGNTSGYFDGSSFLQALDSDDFYLAGNDWTLEFWMNPTSLTNTNPGNTTRMGLFQQGETSTNLNVFVLELLNTGAVRFLYRWPDSASVDFQTPDGTISAGQWYHVALVRKGSNFYIFINGVQKGSATNSRAFDNLAYPVNIGTRYYTGVSTTANAFKGYMNGLRFTNGVARYTSAFSPDTTPWPQFAATDTYYDSVVSLIHANGSQGSTALYDETGRNWTRYGTTTVSTADSRFGSSSLYFDGTADSYYETPYSNSFYFGTSDFTIEFWMKSSTTITNANAVSLMGDYHDVAKNNRWGIYIWNNQKLGLWYGNGGTAVQLQSSTSVTDGKWHHIAISRVGATLRIFVDGALDATSTSWPTTMTDAGSAFRIGMDGYAPRERYNGYLDEIRITKGGARYTSAFVSSFYPFHLPYSLDPYYTSVVAHNHFNVSPWYENKTQTITTNNSLTLPSLFNDGRFGRCAYFDGTNQYAVKNTGSDLNFDGDFTFEFWTRTSDANAILLSTGGGAASGQFGICQGMPNWASGTAGRVNVWISTGAESSSSWATMTAQTGIADDNWHHIAMVRDNGTVRLYIDGILHASQASSRILYSTMYGMTVGHHAAGTAVTGSYEDWPLKGYVDELRLTKGVCRYRSNFVPSKHPFHNDRYFDKVSALLHFDGAHGSTTVRDYIGRNVTLSGGAKLATEAAKAGTTGLALYAVGDYLTMDNDSSLEIGSQNDYTIEMWFMETGAGNLASLISGPSITLHTGADLGSGQNILGLFGTPGTVVSTSRPAYNVWHHLALTRQSGTTRLFIDGSLMSSSTASYPIGGSTWYIGYQPGTTGRYYRGYVDEFRVTNGVARYTANFTPSSLSHPNT